MPDRSVPVKIGEKSYHIRFDRVDIKAIENSLGVGYHFFLKPGIWGSFTATETFIWRGLREENKSGQLIHVFDQNDDGKDKAGDFLLNYMRDGNDTLSMSEPIVEAFIECGVFKRNTNTETKSDTGDEEKNGITPTGTH